MPTVFQVVLFLSAVVYLAALRRIFLKHRDRCRELEVQIQKDMVALDQHTKIVHFLNTLQIDIPTEGETRLVSTNGDITHFIRIEPTLSQEETNQPADLFDWNLYTIHQDGTEALIDVLGVACYPESESHAIDVIKQRFRNGCYTDLSTGEWRTTPLTTLRATHYGS